MRVWLIHAGESLPTDPGGERPLRMSLLAAHLASAGCQVLWWSSAFDHSYKRYRTAGEARLSAAPNLELYLLRGGGYERNVSVRRFIDHQVLARRFVALAPGEPPPDLIVCTVPTVELAAAGVRYAAGRGIPAVVDVRDLWPDILVDLFPWPIRPLGRLALAPLFRARRRALSQATAITAVSPSYLYWGLRSAARSPTSWDRVFPHGYPRLSYDPVTITRAREGLVAAGVDPGKHIVCFVGMLGRTYDLSTVIDAARLLLARARSDVQFVFAGSGDNADRWRVESANLPSVVFTGWITGEQIAALLSMSSIGLAAYAAGAPQSYPNKFFEYMHSGLPILSSLEGDAAELLRHHRCGMNYRAGDAPGLAHVIDRLLDHAPLRAELASNSRAAFEEHYAADTVYRDMAAHLIQLVERRPNGVRQPPLPQTPPIVAQRDSRNMKATGALPRFEDLAETAGIAVSREAASMIYTRYRLAADLASDRRVLEVGCGAGQGLGLIGRGARFLVGGEYCHTLLRQARSHYSWRFPFTQLSGDHLPFRDNAFDLVLCLEAFYYVPDAIAAFREIARVLAPGGLGLFTSANPERPDFIPSPRSVRYYAADELRSLLTAVGMEVTVEAAFPLQPGDQRGPRKLARRLLHSLGLMPRTLKGRTLLKRLAYGKLRTVPAELSKGFAPVAPRVRVGPGAVRGYKILYVLARKPRWSS